MIKGRTSKKIRKIHRYLGVFLGVQFLFWTLSGLYFSWTNLDDIHGDQYKRTDYQPLAFDSLISPSSISFNEPVRSIELRDINKTPYYWINKNKLYNAKNGILKDGITKPEALYIAKNHLRNHLMVKSIDKISKVNGHHEYRKKLLPAYVISYKTNENLKAYISIKDGKFQTVRHRSWRWFDFLWMTHTMDYQGRDNFNTIVLRVFSFLGFITVMSGFLLWFVSSSSIRKIFKKKETK